MNYEETVKKNRERIESSVFYAVTKEFLEFIEIYPPTCIFIKDEKKMHKLNMLADKVYVQQTAFSSVVNDIHSSLILAGNDVVVPHYVQEVAEFTVRLHRLANAIGELDDKKSKDYAVNQKLLMHFKAIKLKPNQLQSAMVGDVKMMGEKFGFDVDVKECVALYKAHIEKHFPTSN